MKEVKNKATALWGTAAKIAKNLIEFIQASALVIVAAFGAYAVKTGMVDGMFAYVLAVATAIMAVRGAYEFLKTFNK